MHYGAAMDETTPKTPDPSWGRKIEDRERERMREWLLWCMREKHWSAERWARAANLSGTTITRFMNSADENRILSWPTVAKLAEAANVPPLNEHGQVLIAIIRRDQLIRWSEEFPHKPVDITEMDSDERMPVPADLGDCKAVELEDGTLGVCRKAEVPPGKVAVVELAPGRACLFTHAPPLLVPYGHRGEPVPADGAVVLGRLKGRLELFD